MAQVTPPAVWSTPTPVVLAAQPSMEEIRSTEFADPAGTGVC